MKAMLNGWAPIVKAGAVSVVSVIALFLVWANITSTQEALAKLQSLASENVKRLDARDTRVETLNLTLVRLVNNSEAQTQILLDICDRLSKDIEERRACRRFAPR